MQKYQEPGEEYKPHGSPMKILIRLPD
uniref:Uncharacterized protein n=1 Tax=Acrobeloides nanus TaxID=290746 RepID=A0A914CKP7_9BILA